MAWQTLIEAWSIFLVAAIGGLLFKILPDTWREPT